jgi:hypothetical protein
MSFYGFYMNKKRLENFASSHSSDYTKNDLLIAANFNAGAVLYL